MVQRMRRRSALACAAVPTAPPSKTAPERRVAALRDPVTITLDGEPILAERGEPVAAALLAGASS
jgi:hypothetical protein